MKKFLAVVLAIMLVLSVIPGGFVMALSDDAIHDSITNPIYTSVVRDNVPSDWWDNGVNYPRIIQLHNSTTGNNNMLLATFEEMSGGTGVTFSYPIYRSMDLGNTWEYVTKITDPDETFYLGAEYQPSFYELPVDFAGMSKGTILLAGVSIDGQHESQTVVRIYKSSDSGSSWVHLSDVATGGGIENGVWEPELEYVNGELLCYYSDETDPNYSQKIVYRSTTDGTNWSNAVNVVASSNSSYRPGMPVITKMNNGNYFMVYEVITDYFLYPMIHYKVSSDCKNWGDVTSMGTLIQSGDKTLATAPYCIYTPAVGENGTIFVSAKRVVSGSGDNGTDYFYSQDYGATWSTTPHPVPYDASTIRGGYSNGMALSVDGKVLYAINNPTDPNGVQPAIGRGGPRARIESATVEFESGASNYYWNKFGATYDADFVVTDNGFSTNKIAWSESFDGRTTTPSSPHTNYEGISQIVDSKWNIGGAYWSWIGLTERSFGDFAMSFEYSTVAQWGSRAFSFHSSNGWPGTFNSYILIESSDGISQSVSLVNGGATSTCDMKLTPNVCYNMVLTSVGTKANLYIWEKGTNAPFEPTITSIAPTMEYGDFHIYTWDANDYFDNIIIYDKDTIPAVTTSEISSITGKELNNDVLSYDNDFTYGASPFTTHVGHEGINQTIGGKLNIGGDLYTDHGLTGSNFSDFVISFDFESKAPWGRTQLYFHTFTGWPGNANSYLDINVTSENVFQVNFVNGGTEKNNVLTVNGGKKYHVVITSYGTTANLYMWEAGETAPTSPTATAVASAVTAGDFHAFTYDANVCLDNIKIYDPFSLPITKAELESVTELSLGKSIYSNNFNYNHATAPVTMKTGWDGTYSVINNVWNISGRTDSELNLLNNNIANFVYTLEFNINTVWATTVFRFRNGSQLEFIPNGNGTFNVNLTMDGMSYSSSETIEMSKKYQVVIAAVGKKIEVFIWEKGTSLPSTPFFSEEAYDAVNGNFGFYTWDANDDIDNIQIYQVEIDPLTSSDLAILTGEEISEGQLVYSNDFSDNLVPAIMNDAYLSNTTSAIVDGAWNMATNDAYGTYTGLTGKNYTDYVYAFNAKIDSNVADFVFSSDNGWLDYSSYRLRCQYADYGRMQVSLTAGDHNNTVSDDMLLDYGYIYYGTEYNFVFVCKDNKVSVYIWALGDEMPDEALLSIDMAAPAAGDFHFSGWNTNCTIDNIFVYDLSDIDIALNGNTSLRKSFVSGVNFEFNYTSTQNEIVKERGIVIDNDGYRQSIEITDASTIENTTTFGAVATGMVAENELKATGYIVIEKANGSKYYVYSDAINVNVGETGYVKASYGDANGDGTVDIIDLVVAKKSAVGLSTTANINNIEFDGETGITSGDLITMRKMLLFDDINSIMPVGIQYINY